MMIHEIKIMLINSNLKMKKAHKMDNSFNTNKDYDMTDYYDNPEETAREVEELNGTAEVHNEYYDDNDDYTESRIELLTGEAEPVINDSVDSDLLRNTDHEEDYPKEEEE
jgi:hypothetical protein